MKCVMYIKQNFIVLPSSFWHSSCKCLWREFCLSERNINETWSKVLSNVFSQFVPLIFNLEL